MECLSKHVDLLCTGDADATVDHEKGYTPNAQLLCKGLVRPRFGGKRIASEHAARFLWSQPHGLRGLNEDIVFVEPSVLTKMDIHERHHEVVAFPLSRGPMEEAVTVERVGRQRPRRVHGDAFGGGKRADAVRHGLRVGLLPVPFLQDFQRGPGARHVRIQLERTMHDTDLADKTRLRDGFVEADTPNGTPGTNDVGPNVHPDGFLHADSTTGAIVDVGMWAGASGAASCLARFRTALAHRLCPHNRRRISAWCPYCFVQVW